jgi:hypothetical protein
MTQINNINNIQRDISTAFFNNLHAPEFLVSQDVDDSIVSYFEKVINNRDNKDAARALAGAVVYTAKSQNIDPMEILRKFSSLPTGQLNAYLVMFLNLNRISTSMLGVSNSPITNKYVARTILP